MMPAYNLHAYYSIFFIVFEAISLYIFMSIFLAVVYNNYKSNLKREVKESIERTIKLVDNAFDMMKSDVFGREVIIQDDFIKLMKRTLSNKSDQYFKVLWHVLDEDNSGYIDRREFHNLPDLLNIKITEVRPNLFQRYIPKVYNSSYSKNIIKVIKSKYFRYAFDAIILVNAFVILANVGYIEWAFLAVFTLEILLKMYAFGFYMFFGKKWNIFDFVIIGAALIFDIVDEARGDDADANVILDILLILRVMRIVKILHSVNYFKSILNTILHILPSLLTYAAVLFVFIYMFAMVGMEVFKNRIKFYGADTYDDTTADGRKYCGLSEEFKDTSFYKFKYCANNFNDFGSAIIVLLELLVVNQWHILTEGFVFATGTKATRIYFIAFHMISVLNIMNIFTAFVIEAFLLEFNYSKGSLETSLQTKINEMGLAYGSNPVKKKAKKPELEQQESILDDTDEYDDVDADHDNLQFVRSQLAEIVANYTNYSRDTPIRYTQIYNLN
jgi:two pore calcium channel protein 3